MQPWSDISCSTSLPSPPGFSGSFFLEQMLWKVSTFYLGGEISKELSTHIPTPTLQGNASG